MQSFSWLCALANHPSVNVNLEENLKNHFPGIDPWCGEQICCCSQGHVLKKRMTIEELRPFAQSLPVIDFQLMLFNIYLENKRWPTVHHLMAEIGELCQEGNLAELENEWNPNYRSKT